MLPMIDMNNPNKRVLKIVSINFYVCALIFSGKIAKMMVMAIVTAKATTTATAMAMAAVKGTSMQW
jgi:hypothetical protein